MSDPVLIDCAGTVRELRDALVREQYVLGVRPLTTRSRLLDVLEVACAEAGVPRITPHGLRRLAVDALYEAGQDVGLVAALLGQSPMRRAIGAAGLGSIPAGRVLQLSAAEDAGGSPGTPSRHTDEK